jgi:cobalt/nickel transport system ATP-binding protein
VEVKNLCYSYPDGQPALRDINFSLGENEVLGIIGPNGAGKSTLLMHLNGLLQAASGSVTIGELLVTEGNLKLVRRRVGLVFQNPDDQLFSPTVFDDVAFGPLNLGMKPKEVQTTVVSVLERVGLAEHARRSSHHLSLGEKRRLAIACVLAMSPSVLALDEPSSFLDPGGKWQLISLLKTLPGTKIIASHDLELVSRVCRKVLLMDRGQVISQGSVDAILGNRSLLAAHGMAEPMGTG